MTQAQFNLLKAFVACEQEHVYGSIELSLPPNAKGTILVNNAPVDTSDNEGDCEFPVYAPMDYFITQLLPYGIENIKAIELTTPTKHLLIK
jgi:hypothetical protein